MRTGSTIVVLSSVSLLSGCLDTGDLIENPNACEKAYYQELLGAYNGRVTATQWQTSERQVMSNFCEWDVDVEIRSYAEGSGDDFCPLYFDVKSVLLDNSESSPTDYPCADGEMPRGYTADPLRFEYESQNSPTWPIDYYIDMISPNPNHQGSVDPGEYITPMSGTYSTFNTTDGTAASAFILRKNLNGSIKFVPGHEKLEDEQFSDIPVIDNIDLVGELIKQ